MRKSIEMKSLELIRIFSDDELALECVNELILETGDKYWYNIRHYIEDLIRFKNKKH